MRAHRRSFAMIIVLLASAAIFGFAMQGGLAMRLATIETTALRDQDALLRDAQDAAAIVLAGLTSGPGVEETQSGGGFGDSDSNADDDVPELEAPDIPELPAEIRELLFGNLPEPEDDEEGGGADFLNKPRPIRRTTTSGRFTALRQAGTPVQAVRVEQGGKIFEVRLTDEAARININVASAQQLSDYFSAVGLPTPLDIAIAGQIVDWRDADDFVSPRGAEKDTYARQGVAIRNADFATIEELLYLPSVTWEIYDRIKHDLTVVGDGPIYVKSASRAVLLSVPGMNAANAADVLALRDQGLLTEESLEEALTPLSLKALEMLRLEPTTIQRLQVQPVGMEMPPFEGAAIVTDSGGVEAIVLHPPRAR